MSDKVYKPCSFTAQQLAAGLADDAERQLGVELEGNGWAALLGVEDADDDDDLILDLTHVPGPEIEVTVTMEWDSAAECEKRAACPCGHAWERHETPGTECSACECACYGDPTNSRIHRAIRDSHAVYQDALRARTGQPPRALPLIPPPRLVPLDPSRPALLAPAHALDAQRAQSRLDRDAKLASDRVTAAVSRSKLAESALLHAVACVGDDEGMYLDWHRRFTLEQYGNRVRAWCEEHGWHHAPTREELVELLDHGHAAPEPDPDDYRNMRIERGE